jgi:hypothetical protein
MKVGDTDHAKGPMTIRWSHYPADGSIAIQLMSQDGAVMLKATVCMLMPAPDGHIWVKSYSENAGVFDALAQAHVIKPAISDFRNCGFETAFLCELTDLAMFEFNSLYQPGSAQEIDRERSRRLFETTRP